MRPISDVAPLLVQTFGNDWYRFDDQLLLEEIIILENKR